jgi:hypothetical protein
MRLTPGSAASGAAGRCPRGISDIAARSALARPRPIAIGAITRRMGLLSGKRSESRGALDSLFDRVRSVQKSSGQITKDKSSVPAPALPTRLEQLQSETCAWCAKGFDSPYTHKKFCSFACQIAAHYERHEGWRRAVRASLRCETCGTAIIGVPRSSRRFCDPCRRKRIETQKALRYEQERQKRPLVLCQDCGSIIPDAKRSDKLRCDSCRTAAHRMRTRARRAGATGRRGTNQFGRE